MNRRNLLAGIAAIPASSAYAQVGWSPDRPIRVIVPYAAGGGTDLTARVVCEALTQRLGQPVVVENRPGAAGNIGAEFVARAPADGLTLLFTTSSTHATNPALYHNLPFHPLRDFAPVSQVTFIPNLLVVRPDLPVRNLAELIALAKARPGELNFGNSGSGSSQHIAAAVLAARTGIEITQVSYRGGAPAVTDLLGGKIDAIATPLVEVLQHVRADRLRPIAVTTARRSAMLPDVPTIGESLPGFEVALWNGVFAPAGTPPAAVLRLSDEVVAAVRSESVRRKILDQGSEPVGSNAEQFASFVAAELPKWAELVRISGARVE